jgi:hypothetical protein
MNKELLKVAKLDLVAFIKLHPEGLKTVELYSMQWRQYPGPAPSLWRFRSLLEELRSERQIEECVPRGGGWITRRAA